MFTKSLYSTSNIHNSDHNIAPLPLSHKCYSFNSVVSHCRWILYVSHLINVCIHVVVGLLHVCVCVCCVCSGSHHIMIIYWHTYTHVCMRMYYGRL